MPGILAGLETVRFRTPSAWVDKALLLVTPCMWDGRVLVTGAVRNTDRAESPHLPLVPLLSGTRCALGLALLVCAPLCFGALSCILVWLAGPPVPRILVRCLGRSRGPHSPPPFTPTRLSPHRQRFTTLCSLSTVLWWMVAVVCLVLLLGRVRLSVSVCCAVVGGVLVVCLWACCVLGRNRQSWSPQRRPTLGANPLSPPRLLFLLVVLSFLLFLFLCSRALVSLLGPLCSFLGSPPLFLFSCASLCCWFASSFSSLVLPSARSMDGGPFTTPSADLCPSHIRNDRTARTALEAAPTKKM